MGESTEQVLTALNNGGVRYLIVGEVAIKLHGHPRTTTGLDLVIHLHPDNLELAADAFSEIGYRPRAPVTLDDFADAATRKSWIEEEGLTVLSLRRQETPDLEVNLLLSAPFDFAEAEARALIVDLDTAHARALGLADLIALLKVANRPQDQSDIEALEAIGAKAGAAGE